MKLSKTLKLSFNMLMHSKLRSWLTIIGIFIGVAAVVAIISLGQGLQQSVNSQISGLGQDIITISSGSSRALGGGDFGGGGGRSSINIKPLSDKDLQALRLVPNIKSIDGVVSGRATVAYQSQNTSVSIQGDDPSVFSDFLTTSLQSGRYLGSGDAGVVVIGSGVSSNIFSSAVNVGSNLVINGKPFRVIGILAAASGFGGGDNGIYMSTKDARNVLGNTTTLGLSDYSSIQVKVVDVNYINDTTNAITAVLANSHHVASGKEDFSVTSAQALQERFSSITSGITLFLGVIAAISLLVGGIGVANTMFTSVLEKTRDIGVMKSIGAKNSDILLIFLFNSGLLGLVGGLLGIFFGILIDLAFPLLGLSAGLGGAGRGGFTIPVNGWLMFGAVVFSISLGMAFGAIPAYNASKLKPVDALRYE
jgi:putative ABC transport system permease protein